MNDLLDEQHSKAEKEVQKSPAEEELCVEKKVIKQRRNRLIVNSETVHDCWFIENPSNKDLTKKITLKLGP